MLKTKNDPAKYKKREVPALLQKPDRSPMTSNKKSLFLCAPMINDGYVDFGGFNDIEEKEKKGKKV